MSVGAFNKYKYFAFVVLSLFIAISLFAKDSLEEQLRRDIENRRLDDFHRINAAFILSGIDAPDSLDVCLNWYHSILQTIRDFHFDPFDRTGSASKVFMYLHSTWLRQYNKESTTLLDVMEKKQFNCVSATILYNLLCEDLGWSTEAFETPTHVYTVFTNFTEKVMVENTSPMGFDIMKNLRQYSQFLLQFYPENRALKIGLDRIYVYENSRGRPIDNTELLGLLAYNRAYLAEKKNGFPEAYQLVLFAQRFNSDSRSNVDFEIGLFYKWGGALFHNAKYEEAFDVFIRALTWYPDIGDFRSNARSAFLNALSSSWSSKDWSLSYRMAGSVSNFNFLKEEDFRNIKSLFHNWILFLSEARRDEDAKKAKLILQSFSE